VDTRCPRLWFGSAPSGVDSRIPADPCSLVPRGVRSLVKKESRGWEMVGRHVFFTVKRGVQDGYSVGE